MRIKQITFSISRMGERIFNGTKTTEYFGILERRIDGKHYTHWFQLIFKKS